MGWNVFLLVVLTEVAKVKGVSQTCFEADNCTWESIKCSHLATRLVCSDLGIEGSIESLDFHGMPEEVTFVTLASNSITTLGENAFKNVGPQVNEFSISQNKIEVIHPGAFTGLSQVHHLNLEKNSLRGLELGAFSGLGNLSVLILSGNVFAFLSANEFRSLSSLTLLDLSSNFITNIHKRAFAGLVRITSISLSHNPIFEYVSEFAFLECCDELITYETGETANSHNRPPDCIEGTTNVEIPVSSLMISVCRCDDPENCPPLIFLASPSSSPSSPSSPSRAPEYTDPERTLSVAIIVVISVFVVLAVGLIILMIYFVRTSNIAYATNAGRTDVIMDGDGIEEEQQEGSAIGEGVWGHSGLTGQSEIRQDDFTMMHGGDKAHGGRNGHPVHAGDDYRIDPPTSWSSSLSRR
eukprot:gb/GEZN01007208.1/.p1 GENE.gb/GEZN01007208.1/~~gb/GEZN01007208.1/.p1  ORF type:complete len:458 (-),score=34.63 gb/GEZN01007208.1/:192-1424(-)